MALRPTKGMLTGSKETKTLPGESGPFDPNAGTPTSFDDEVPPGDDQRPTEDILTEENVFEMLMAIMAGTQGVPEGTTAEVSRRASYGQRRFEVGCVPQPCYGAHPSPCGSQWRSARIGAHPGRPRGSPHGSQAHPYGHGERDDQRTRFGERQLPRDPHAKRHSRQRGHRDSISLRSGQTKSPGHRPGLFYLGSASKRALGRKS